MTIMVRPASDKAKTKISDSVGRMEAGIVELFPQFFISSAVPVFPEALYFEPAHGQYRQKRGRNPSLHRFGLIIELTAGMQPILNRTRLRVREKKNQWKEYFYRAGDLTAFMLRFFREVFMPPYEWRETLYQCYLV